MPNVMIDVVNIKGAALTFGVTLSVKVTSPTPADIQTQPVRPGRFGCTLPEAQQNLAVTASSVGFWPLETSVFYSPSAQVRPATTNTGGGVASIDIDRTPAGVTLTITLTLQKIADVTAQSGISFGSPHKAMKVEREILNPAGSGGTLLNITQTSVGVTPNLFFLFQWKSGGARVGVYVPQKATLALGNYNLFFKPPKHDTWTTPDVAGLYMTWNGTMEHKSLIAQTEFSGSSYVLCLAFEEDGPLGDYGASSAGAMALLEEIDFFLRLRLTGTASKPAVGKVALSCFSAGATHVSAIVAVKGTELLSRLKGLFILDGNDFDVRSLVAADRAIRIYVAESKFANVASGSGTTRRGPYGSFEYRGGGALPGGDPALIYLYAPQPLWHDFNPYFKDWMSVHQIIPSYFMSHALMTSGV